jgi:hypothetical protein
MYLDAVQDTLVRDAMSKRRNILGPHRPRDALSEGRNVLDFSFGTHNVRGHIVMAWCLLGQRARSPTQIIAIARRTEDKERHRERLKE